MALSECPQCGSFLFPGDGAECPSCRQTIIPDDEPILLEDELETDEAELIPAADSSFAPAEEVLYQDTRSLLLGPEKPAANRLLTLGLTLALFAYTMRGGRSMQSLLILIGVLFFHELGHWLGMRWFGYRDVKMFFIPFFGAAVSGKKEGAPQWQQAIVLLLGPLPGILVGCVFLFANIARHDALIREIGLWLVGLNAFNLLPLVPLDGGRLLNLIIFSRHRVLESVFLVLAALGVMGLGMLLHAYLFVGLGVLGLMVAPTQYRTARAANAIQGRWPVLPSRLVETSEAFLRDLFREVRQFQRPIHQGTSKLCATTMKAVHERALVRPPSLGASVGLLAAYGAGFALAAAAVLAFVLESGRRMPPA